MDSHLGIRMSPGRQESSLPETLRSLILTTTSRFEYSATMMVGFKLGRVARESEEGWESIQRMTEHRRRGSREGNRLHVAIPDESLKSQTVG